MIKSLWNWLRYQTPLITPFEWRRDRFIKWASAGRVGWQPEAADFNLAATLVAPWEEYVLDLSPDFKLSPPDALKKVIPNTAAIEEKIVESWSASVQATVGGPGGKLQPVPANASPALPKDGSPHEGAEGKPPKGGKEGDGKAEHEAGQRKTPSAGAHHAPIAQPGADQPTGKDPMLEYAAATALYQEVKLLNRYVADAALRRDYRAYVVRLQMSVVPFARHSPFDVYSNISFFPTREPKAKDAGPKAKRYPAEVIPLLVTDNLENTIRSRSVDSMRDLALTLSFLQPPGGFLRGIGLNRKREQFQRALGADLNSLLTVGRVSDNTLQVRLGAERDVASSVEYAMLPRTHNITVLLLVPADFVENDDPKTFPRVTAVSKTQLRDAETGMNLAHQSQTDRIGHVQRLCKISSRQDTSELAERLLRKVFDNDVEGFEAELSKNKNWHDPAKSSGNPLDLWCNIVETLGASEFTAVRFDLPPPAQLPDRQSVLAVDDGHTTTIHLQGGARLNENGVTATLLVKTKAVGTEAAETQVIEREEVELAVIDMPGGERAVVETDVVETEVVEAMQDNRLRIAATDINILVGGHGMTIAFPSLSAWKICDRKGDVRHLQGSELRLTYGEGGKWDSENKQAKPTRYPVVFYTSGEPVDAAERPAHRSSKEKSSKAAKKPR